MDRPSFSDTWSAMNIIKLEHTNKLDQNGTGNECLNQIINPITFTASRTLSYCNKLNIMDPCSRTINNFRLISLPCSSSTHRKWNSCVYWSLRSAVSELAVEQLRAIGNVPPTWANGKNCSLILHSGAPSVCCCSNPCNVKCYSTRKPIYSVLWTTGYLEIVEYQACTENVRVYTHKVWLLGVHHHLHSLTMQGKIPFLGKMNSSALNCNNTMSVPYKIPAWYEFTWPLNPTMSIKSVYQNHSIF